jgi:outer membrane scaffolding protein for murein synthesis (MipA/OmpV family)
VAGCLGAIRGLAVGLALSVSVMPVVHAEELPLWELAVGGGALQVPEYRGSDDNRQIAFPFIYPVYRGNFLRIDDRGVRGVFYGSERIELDISADANTSVDSDGASARAGMPDLDPTLQLGPILQVRLWPDRPTRQVLSLNLPVRSVFAIGDSVEQVGWTASPHLTFYQRVDLFDRRWRLGLTAGLEFGDDEFHDYYYRVNPEFATDTRPAYDADGGFGGTRFIASFVSRGKKSWMSFFARYDRLGGATFDDSPLVERNDGLTFGFIYARFIARSKRLVEVKEMRRVEQAD